MTCSSFVNQSMQREELSSSNLPWNSCQMEEGEKDNPTNSPVKIISIVLNSSHLPFGHALHRVSDYSECALIYERETSSCGYQKSIKTPRDIESCFDVFMERITIESFELQ